MRIGKLENTFLDNSSHSSNLNMLRIRVLAQGKFDTHLIAFL